MLRCLACDQPPASQPCLGALRHWTQAVCVAVVLHLASQAHAQQANQPDRVEWLRDNGFGIFVHWSLDSQVGSVISHSLVGASEDYKRWFFNDLPTSFNPRRWSPDELTEIAKLSGAKYVVLTTKHHSGFCMWDTETTSFNISKTPYKKDILTD